MTGKPKPREVLRAAVRAIAGELATNGFRYLATKQTLTRVSDKSRLVLEIYFQANRRNHSSDITAWPHIRVYAEQPPGPHNLLLECYLSEATDAPDATEWQFAGASWTPSVAAIVEVVRTRVLPAFEAFGTPADVERVRGRSWK